MRSLSTGASPQLQRSLAPLDYPYNGSFREQEAPETTAENAHNNYENYGGPSNPSSLYNDRRRSTGPMHQSQTHPYDYRGAAPLSDPYSMGRQSPAFDHGRRVSAPAQYLEPVQYHDAPAHYHDTPDPYRDRSAPPNMRIPRQEARMAVLETARQHLSEEEARRVEDALRLATRSQAHRELRQANTDTQHSGGSSS